MGKDPRIKVLGIVDLKPSGRINDIGERKRVRFRKAKIGKSLDLSKDFFANFHRDTPIFHPFNERTSQFFHFLRATRRAHGSTQFISLSSRKARNIHSDVHHLFLKKRNSQGLFQSRTKKWMQIAHFLFSSATTQVGMDGLALNRARTHQSNLNDNVIKTPRAKPGKHIHLCP